MDEGLKEKISNLVSLLDQRMITKEECLAGIVRIIELIAQRNKKER